MRSATKASERTSLSSGAYDGCSPPTTCDLLGRRTGQLYRAALPGGFTGRLYWAEPSGGASSASRGASASSGPACAGTATGSVAVEYLTQPHSRWSQYLPGLSPTSPRVPRRINLVHRFARIGLLQSGWPVGETDPQRRREAEDRDQH